MVSVNDPDPIPLDEIEANRVYRRTELPRPYPDPEAWDANLKLSLDLYPDRKANYDRYRAAKKSVNVDYLPIKMDVENVSRCNFRCTMCQVSGWGPTYQRARDMTLDEFKDLVDENYGLIELKLQGMGEPLLGRDVYFDMIRYARSKQIWVRTTNNGSLLHFQDNYKKLIDSGINEVQISIDGTTKETFEKIRVGSNFDLVVKNCKLINDYCDEKGILRTRMATVLQRDNVDEFEDFVTLGAELGFKRLSITISLSEWGQDSWSKANREITVEDRITPEIAGQAIELGKSLGIEVTFWNVTDKYDINSPDTLCRWPFERVYISSEMRVVPCCMMGDPKVMDLGDAHEFTKVWNSDDMQEFRRAHLEGRIPKPCQFCYKMTGSNNTPVQITTNGEKLA